LDQKLREEIVVALEKAYIKAGAKDFEHGMEQVAKFVTWLPRQRKRRWRVLRTTFCYSLP
jgi:hypothetical protein